MRPAVTRRLAAMVVAFGLIATLASAAPVLAASITVTSLTDTAANDGECTLREAIIAANTDTASGASAGECAAGSGTDLISFGVGVAGTITVGSVLPGITSAVEIDGDGSITVSGGGTVRVFDINLTGSAGLMGLAITNGFTVADGGGIRNSGSLVVRDSTFSGNTAGSEGAAIDNLGTLTLTNSTFNGNSAINAGAILSSGVLTVTNSTFTGNSATALGGAIATVGTTTVTNSTFSGNTASSGGALFNNFGTLTVTNSTISGNSASTNGGGIRAQATETMVNSIVAGNTAPVDPDFSGTAETATFNILGDPTGILDPAGLADNGGPTQTIALVLLAGNSAIDSAGPPGCAASPVNGIDQRGLPRPAACDIGAYEAQPPTVAAHANVSATATSTAGAVVTYTAPAGLDEQGGTAAVACLPASGSTFAVGSTTVTCTATDAVGHTGSGTFAVNVAALAGSPTATASPTPTSTASPTPTSTASPGLLPNTASGSGTTETPGLPAAFALIGLLSIVVLGRRVRASREARLGN